MKIAIASSDFTKVTGHAGRARKWLVYDITSDGQIIQPPQRVEFSSDMVFHHFQDDGPHPLDDIQVIIATSAGEGFLKHMEKRGIDAVLTGETDPMAAAQAYLAEKLPPPKPRPIGSLICKTLDLFSKHG